MTFFFLCRYDVCHWEILKNRLNHWCHHMYILQKKSTFFCSRLVLISSFCAAFFRSKLQKDFLTSSVSIWLKLKTWELFLALINVILGWSLYLSSVFRIGSCSDESGHLYPFLGIFKIEILIKYMLNFLAIWLPWKIILSSSTKLILECFVTFSDRSSLTVFQNVLL